MKSRLELLPLKKNFMKIELKGENPEEDHQEIIYPVNEVWRKMPIII